MRIAIAQMNPSTGDFDKNLAEALAFAELAKDAGADIVMYPAYALSGDADGALFFSRAFARRAHQAVYEFAALSPLPAVIGSLYEEDEETEGFGVSAAFFCNEGEVTSLVSPDEETVPAFTFGDLTFAVCVEDLLGFANAPQCPDVIVEMSAIAYKGFDTLICQDDGLACERDCAKTSAAYVVHANLVGGQEDKVYSGGSYVMDASGEVVAQGDVFATDLIFAEVLGRDSGSVVENTSSDSSLEKLPLCTAEADYRALVLATRDFLDKSGFTDCVIGLSGGIDSAMVAAIATDALGAPHVHGVLMPSQFSSEGSIVDAQALADNLDIDTRTIPIKEPLDALCVALGPACGGQVKGVAHENLQARVRTLYLMGLSNTFGWALVNTGNKSEAAMGFSTLYGDTAGAFAPLGDMYKTQVYELAEWRNSQGEVIPREILRKAPSAELHEGQLDSDRLPEYGKLDEVLRAHIEEGMDREELVEAGFDAALCEEVLLQVARSEFKRRQEPMAPEISPFSFKERGWPVTNRFVDKAR